MALGCVAGTIFTYSRGDSIGLAVVTIMIMIRSKRKIASFGAMALVAAGAIYLLGDSYLDRMATLKDPEQEASAKQRLDQNKVAFAMWQDYPLFGTGFGGEKYQRLTSEYGGEDQIHIVHNTYIQLLVESGICTVFIYVVLLLSVIFWLQGSIRRANSGVGWAAAYPLALQTTLIGFAVVIIFHPRARYDLYYMLIMAASAWYYIQRAATAEAEAPAERLERVEACV
jgi:O-antigen ligase